jgi:ferrous iron transport protein B
MQPRRGYIPEKEAGVRTGTPELRGFMAQGMHVALAGNPNCGKTTLFNELTGSNGYVGNWPGVTVEKKEAAWLKDGSVTFTDLPGIYSLSPYSPEEVVSRDYLVHDRPEAVIDLVDVTNLERNLYLTTQVLECGLPVVIGLNMCDLLAKSGDAIDAAKLSEELGVPCVEVSALKARNLDALVSRAVKAGRAGVPASPRHAFADDVEHALDHIATAIKGQCLPELTRWYSIKVFERDAEAIKPLGLTGGEIAALEPVIKRVEKSRSDDSESIITSERYDWIARVIEECVVKAPTKLTTTERIDRVVTSRALGLPIFVAVMVLVYFLAVSTVGTAATDWANDGLFGDGWHLFGNGDAEFGQADDDWQANDYPDQISAYIAAAADAGVDATGVQEAIDAEDPTDEDAATIATFEKAAAAANVAAYKVPIRDANGNYLDTEGELVDTDGIGDDATPVLKDGEELATIDSVDADAFATAVETPEPDPADYGVWVPGIPTIVSGWLADAGASALVTSLVIDGIVAGVGSILGFVPQMIVLFLMLCFLEDCGYMSRVAFVMDRVFRKFGLSGKSFIPMLISSGCGVPGIMATKTIENESDRRMTIMTTTMVPCGAKLPIIALLMGALIGGSTEWWIAPLFYFMGVIAVILSGVMLKKTRPFAGDPAPFVMELPAYHLPAVKSWLMHVWERVKAFVMKAGTIIFAASVVIWFLSNFGLAGWDGGTGAFGYLPGMDDVPSDYMDFSLLAGIGSALAWMFYPLGFGTWQAVASTISGLIAKENLVSTYAVLFGLGSSANEASTSMWNGFANMFVVDGIMHTGAMFAFVAFNLLCAPCFAAMGAMKRQMDDARWWWFAIGYECGLGWVVGLIINQLYELLVFGSFGFWTVVAFALVAGLLFQIFRPAPKLEHADEKILSSLADEAA